MLNKAFPDHTCDPTIGCLPYTKIRPHSPRSLEERMKRMLRRAELRRANGQRVPN